MLGDPNRRLTELQERFAAAYARQPHGMKDATQAAREAGSTAAPNHVKVSAIRMLRQPHVQRRIMELDPRHEQARTGVDAAWLLNQLAGLWDVPLEALFTDDGTLRPLKEMSPEAQKLISSMEVRSEHVETDGGEQPIKVRITRVKLIDRLKILQDIGRHVDVRAYTATADEQVTESLARLMAAAAKRQELENERAERSSGAIDVSPSDEGGTPSQS